MNSGCTTKLLFILLQLKEAAVEFKNCFHQGGIRGRGPSSAEQWQSESFDKFFSLYLMFLWLRILLGPHFAVRYEYYYGIK